MALDAFTEAILPVLSIAGAGYLLGRYMDVDAKPLSTVTIYVLAPALVFDSLIVSSVGGVTGLKVVLSAVLMTFVMWGVSGLFGWASGLEGERRGALELTGAFPNTANYGIPLSVFAFPGVGRTTAVLYVIGSSIMIYTVGVYIASSKSSIRRVFELPLVYAVILAITLNYLGVSIPGSQMQIVGLVGDSAIPVMLLILGIQLAHTSPSGGLADVSLVNVLRLLVAPVLAVPVVLALGLSGDVGRVVVLESGMPVAVTTLLFSIEFRGDVDYVATAVLTTTLSSVITLTILIYILQSGWVI